jgi:UDP-glucose 4-epimerase
MAKRALVTGGAGFIGSHVADLFLDNGYEVVIIDDLSNGDRENLPRRATFHQLDIGSPEAASILERGDFDIVCHLAAQLDVRKSVADPLFDARSNIVATLNLLEAVKRAGGRARFIFASTGGAIYGDGAPLPSPENVVKNPQSPYGIAKLSVEHYLTYYANIHRLQTVALRFANVYGPRQGLHGEAGVVAIFCKRIVAGQSLTIFGDGTQTRDYVFVGDVARAHLLAAGLDLPAATDVDARAFNLGTATETDVNELARTLVANAKSPVPIEHAPARPGEQHRSVVDWSKARRLLGWEPKTAVHDGLARTYSWFAGRASAESRATADGTGGSADSGSRATVSGRSASTGTPAS